MSQAFSASMFIASCSGAAASLPPKDGALPPAFEVEKYTGSMKAKSPSSTMRCISTEPTMPRQPTRPTRFMFITLY